MVAAADEDEAGRPAAAAGRGGAARPGPEAAAEGAGAAHPPLRLPDAAPGAERARAFLGLIPHAMALGIGLEQAEAGVAVLSMPWDARLVGDPRTGVIHGGAVSALMDTCCGTAVMTLPGGTVTATIDLRIDYMRPATPGQAITARAEVYHVTRSVVFVRATATDDDAGRPVATATGAFTNEGAEPFGEPA